jgi:malonyl CoA-acyl carrier protein transacylase
MCPNEMLFVFLNLVNETRSCVRSRDTNNDMNNLGMGVSFPSSILNPIDTKRHTTFENVSSWKDLDPCHSDRTCKSLGDTKLSRPLTRCCSTKMANHNQS